MLSSMAGNEPTDHATLVRVTHFYPSEGNRDSLVGLLKTIADSARGAQGCFGGQVCDSDQDTEAVVAISRWQDRESMDRFHESAEFGGVMREIQPTLARPSRTEHFHTI
jgi:quinol monooxygenase YgiN